MLGFSVKVVFLNCISVSLLVRLEYYYIRRVFHMY